MAITLQQAKSLKHGDHVHHVSAKNADGTPMRWHVTGKVKTWKTRPDEVKVPVKRGMYENDYITERNMHEVNLGYGS